MIKSTSVKIRKVAVMSKKEKATYLILLTIGILITAVFGIWWFQPYHIPNNFAGTFHVFDLIIYFLLSYIIWYEIINYLFSWDVMLDMRIPKPLPPQKNLKVAFLTAFVPGKEPYDILEKTLKAMVHTSYPHDTWLLDEGKDPVAGNLCKIYNVKHFSRYGIKEYNQSDGPFKAKTKAGNYNAWYDNYHHFYDVVAQLDVDFVPKKNFLTRTLGYFRDPSIAFVVTPQIYGNQSQSWIARGAAEQAFNFYGQMQKGLFGKDMTLFIGANHVLRVGAHRQVKGYSGHIVEDHLTGMRMYAKRWKSVYVPEVLAVGEGPATWDAYFNQQMRWAFGLIHILFTKSPRLFPQMNIIHALNYFLLQQYYFYGLAQGIGVILISLYFFFGIQSTSMSLLVLILLYMPVLFMQQIVFLWLQRYNIQPKVESGFLLKGRFLNFAVWPIYLLSLLGVVVGRRLVYKVTPKGSAQTASINLLMFMPHLVLGTITTVGLIASFYTHNQAPQLIFFALLNSVIMYTIVFVAMKENLNAIIGIVWSEVSNFKINISPIRSVFKTIRTMIFM